MNRNCNQEKKMAVSTNIKAKYVNIKQLLWCIPRMISLIVQILACLEQLDNFVRQEALDLPKTPQEGLHIGHLRAHNKTIM